MFTQYNYCTCLHNIIIVHVYTIYLLYMFTQYNYCTCLHNIIIVHVVNCPITLSCLNLINMNVTNLNVFKYIPVGL